MSRKISIDKWKDRKKYDMDRILGQEYNKEEIESRMKEENRSTDIH